MEGWFEFDIMLKNMLYPFDIMTPFDPFWYVLFKYIDAPISLKSNYPIIENTTDLL